MKFNTKRIISLLLSLIILSTVFAPGAVFAVEDDNSASDGVSLNTMPEDCLPEVRKLTPDEALGCPEPQKDYAAAETETFGRYGYTCLNDAQKTAYEAMVGAIRNLDCLTLVRFPAITEADMQLCVDMVIADYPELFWFIGGYGYFVDDGYDWSGFVPHFHLEGVETDDIDAINEAKVILDNAVSDFLDDGPSTSGYGALLDIHDRLALHVEYDIDTADDQSAYGALVNGKAVCAGYAKAYQLLVNAHPDTSISCTYFTGTGNGGLHAWNMTTLTKNTITYYMYTDVTWDDQETNLYHAYFNMPLSVMEYDHITDSHYLKPTGTDAFSYFKQGVQSKYTNAGVGIITSTSETFEKSDFAERVSNGKLAYAIDVWCDPKTNGNMSIDTWWNSKKITQANVLHLFSGYTTSRSSLGCETRIIYISKESVNKGNQNKPETPSLKSATFDSITLNNIISPYGTTTVYSRDGGVSWQVSPVFTNLEEGTQYTFYAKFLENDSYNESPMSYPGTASTKAGLPQDAPAAPTVLFITENSIAVTPYNTNDNGNYVEYSLTGDTWQHTNVFENLTRGAVYTVYARYSKGNGYSPSPKIASGKILCGTLEDAAEFAINGSYSGNNVNSVCVTEKVSAQVTSAYDLGTLTYTWTYGANNITISSGTASAEIIVPAIAAGTDLKLSVSSSIYRDGPVERTAAITKAYINSGLTVKLVGSESGELSSSCKAGETVTAVAEAIPPFVKGMVSYQWYLNDEPITGKTGESIVIPKTAQYAGAKLGVKVTSTNFTDYLYKTVNISKISQSAPSAPKVSYVLSDAVCLKAPGGESNSAPLFSKDGGNTWQESPLFTGLTSGREYTFVVKFKADEGFEESAVSGGTTVTPGSFSDFAEVSVSGSISGDEISACKPGEVLTAKLSDGEFGNVKYQWLAGGSVVKDKSASPEFTVTDEYAGKTVTVRVFSDYYQSGFVSADAEVSKLEQNAPETPEVIRITGTTVTLNEIQSPNGTAVEYSADGGASWQSSNYFTNLSKGESYTFAARFVGNDAYEASPVSGTVSAVVGYFSDAAEITVSGSLSGDGISACKPGEVLTAKLSDGEFGTVTYQWICGGNVIAEGNTFEVPSSTLYVGKTLTVRAESTLYTDGPAAKDVEVLKSKLPTPSAPSVTAQNFTTVKLLPVTSPAGTAVKYICGGSVWQDSHIFTGLKPKTEYTFYVKFMGDSVNEESAVSPGTTVTTVCDKGEFCPCAKFKDVSVSSWFHVAVDYVKEHGIMSGKSTTTFVPNANLTRAEIVQVLYNMAGKPEVTIENPFKDLKESHWYYNAVLWAVENNIASGTSSTTFGATGLATREQVVLMLRKYVALKGGDVSAASDISGYSDAGKVSSWALEAVKWGVSEGVISGTTATTISPKGNTTRAQFAQMIFNYFGK